MDADYKNAIDTGEREDATNSQLTTGKVEEMAEYAAKVRAVVVAREVALNDESLKAD